MAWTSEEFQELLIRLRSNFGDFTDVEVKRAFGGCPDLKETLCAFGNMPEGGTIILGLDEATGFSATGIAQPAEMEAAVASQARNGVIPPVQVQFERAKLGDKTIILVGVESVPPSDRPCRTVKGKHAYLRQSDGDYRMSEQEIQQILASKQRPRHDVTPVDDTSIEDLDIQLRDHFIATARAASRRLSNVPEVEILRFKRILEPSGDRLTQAGLYALGKYPQQFAPHFSITAVAEPAVRGEVRNLDRIEFDGPLPELLDRAVEWVQRNTRTEIRFGASGHGLDESEIPMVAVRELIANALVHRDLGPHTTGKDVQIRLTNDYLIISNPGGLWGLSRDQLGLPGAKSAVNEFLYEICKLTRTASAHRVIEGEGGGLREVNLALKDAGLRQPEYHDSGVTFTALIPRHALIGPNDLKWLSNVSADMNLSEIQSQILVSMRRGQAWNNQLVRDEFGPLDSTDARAALQGLVNLQLAVASGSGRGTSYMIHPELAGSASSIATEQITIETPQEVPLIGAASLLGEPDVQTDPPGDSATGIMSKNAEAVWNELGDASHSATEIAAATGLTPGQIRYALRPLLTSGFVVRDGGQGHRRTTYRRAI